MIDTRFKRIEEHWDIDFNEKYKDKFKSPSPFAQKALDYIKKNNINRMLEIGPGAGRDTVLFYMQNIEITALDISSCMLDCLRKKLPNLQTIHADIRQGVKNLPSDSFDCVYARLALHYFNDNDTKAVFQELHRIIRKGGFLFIEARSHKDNKYTNKEMVDEYTYKTEYGGCGHLFTEDSLRDKAKDFYILELEEWQAINSDGNINSSYILIAKK